MGRLINIASLSDIHLGAPNIPSDVIPTNIRKVLFPVLDDELDVLILVGDLTDGLLEFGSDTSRYVMGLIDDLIDLALKHRFYIRILQGTFTHDRLQSSMFKFKAHKLNQLNGSDIIKFIDKIDIEHIESLGVTLLYKPDNIPYKDAWKRMAKLVDEVGYPIDFLINHGYFTHLLPRGIRHEIANTLDVNIVNKVVRGGVLNGHVHTPSVNYNVINNGSFDRLNHGEEEAKGFFYLTYDTSTFDLVYTFIENVYATKFCTVDLSGNDDVNSCKAIALDKVTEVVKTSQSTCPDMFIRIIHVDATIRAAVTALLASKYHNLIITGLKAKEEDAISKSSVELFDDTETLPVITTENIVSMIYAYAQDHKLTMLTEEYIREKLNDQKHST